MQKAIDTYVGKNMGSWVGRAIFTQTIGKLVARLQVEHPRLILTMALPQHLAGLRASTIHPVTQPIATVPLFPMPPAAAFEMALSVGQR